MVPLYPEVVFRGADAKLHLFELDGLLVFPSFVLPLVKLVEVLPVVNDAAYGGIGGRRNLHEVESLAAREFQGLEEGHDAELLALFVDDSNFLGADPFVHSGISISDSPSLLARQGRC